MKFVIDASSEFDGSVITSMCDDEHCDYSGSTLDQLKVEKKNPNLRLATPEEIRDLVNLDRKNKNRKAFKEITEEKYYDLLDCLPPKRMGTNWFFVGECYQYDLYPFCFTIDGRYFMGERIVSTPQKELQQEMNDFYNSIKEKEYAN